MTTTSEQPQQNQESTADRTGLFIGSWEAGARMPGAPLLRVDLMFEASSRYVSGHARITQAVSPPLDVRVAVQGDYTYLTVEPDRTHILLTLSGYPAMSWPSRGGVGPVIPPEMTARIVLDPGWQGGTANYRYLDSAGSWHSVEAVPVTRCDQPAVAGRA
ncbi:DUF1842 domain-containing protein [Saccharothrix longispora]|uniref:DUF1842 domain-containing protein n=1 Tax=Saccharothrix longispora TaxID=33920 RepID=UPI0028FD6821|nr:DUF1842 domain-containing protein [Saccharothrix longispora]MBY8850708.1 DUF1842 domain-containing protein [Saccharothrix sp. MB29]MDU0288171.1 DUF1842 domain-containing protein [Saccharothrix longispora]